MNDPRIIDAQNQVEAKRAQLMHSVKHAIGEAKRRLAPDLLAEQAWKASWEAARHKGGEIADDATSFAKEKPWLVGGIAAAAALFLARKPVGKLAVGAYDAVTGRDEKSEAELADDALEAEAPNNPVAVAGRAKRVSGRKKKEPKVENVK